jgi:hypothetical protein
LRSRFPLPQTELAYSDGSGNAKRGKAVKDRSTDLDFRDLPIEVTGRKALTKQFNTMHPCFDAAPAVISGQLSPQRTAKIF